MPEPVSQQASPQAVIVRPLKSVGISVLLALVFGPLGMLYSTVLGAIVMFIVNLVALVLTAGLGLVIAWPAGVVWAAMAASNHNKSLVSGKSAY